MKRRMATLLAMASMASGLVLFTPAAHAQEIDICAGTGSASVPGGLNYPATAATTPAPANTSGFTATLTGACAGTSGTATSLTAGGTVTGWCGLSVGNGTASAGAASGSFNWVGVGGTLYLSGEVTAVVNAVPDTLSGSTCSTLNGATTFLINGAGLLTPCTIRVDQMTDVTVFGTTLTVKVTVCIQ